MKESEPNGESAAMPDSDCVGLDLAASPILKFLSDVWEKHKAVLLCILLFGLVVWVFAPSLDCGFLFYDENDEIAFEPHVNTGVSLENISWAFTSLNHSNWYPVNWLSHMLDCEFFGFDSRGHHLTSVLIHAVNCVLVFVVFRTMTGALWRSFLVALLFGLHPLRVESVTWICERKDVLSLFFWLLTLLAYARYAKESKIKGNAILKYYCITLLFFAFGLMSKAMLVTLPFVLLLLDFWPLELWRNKSKLRLVLEKVPLLVFAAVCSGLVYKAQQLGGTMQDMADLPISDRMGNAVVSYVRYIGKFFWPENLATFYPHPGHWPFITVFGSMLFVASISILTLCVWKRWPFLLVGWFWYLGTLVPVIGLVQLMSQAMANRYTYIPMLGFVFGLVWLVAELTKNWRCQAVIMLIFGISLFAACVVRTRNEIQFFKDDITVWTHTVEVTKDENNWQAHFCLGTVLVDASGHTGVALKEFQETVRLKPDFAPAEFAIGGEFVKQVMPDEALLHFKRALQLKPDWGQALFNCGYIYFREGQTKLALEYVSRALDKGFNPVKCKSIIDSIPLLSGLETQ